MASLITKTKIKLDLVDFTISRVFKTYFHVYFSCVERGGGALKLLALFLFLPP